MNKGEQMNDLEKEFLGSLKALCSRYSVVLNMEVLNSENDHTWIFSSPDIFLDIENIAAILEE